MHVLLHQSNACNFFIIKKCCCLFVHNSLRKAWIEVLMHPDLPKNLEDKVRERLKNANDGALICSPDGTGLKV